MFALMCTRKALYEVVSPSVLPCLGTLAYYLRGIAAQLLMDAGMAGEAKSHEVVLIERQSLHLVFGSGCLDGHDVMHTRCTADVTARDASRLAILLALLAQRIGSQLLDAQLLPLAAVVYFLLVLGYLVRYASPVSFLVHTLTTHIQTV